jgi:hypothetical protein
MTPRLSPTWMSVGADSTSSRYDGRFQVVPQLRHAVVFARHDLLKDAPFTQLDLVSCRNLLIYFRPPAQKHALTLPDRRARMVITDELTVAPTKRRPHILSHQRDLVHAVVKMTR